MEQENLNKIATFYYSRKDVQQAIFEFCKNRETVPRYYEGFGKRPDSLEYPSDLLMQVQRGATSFHCSEEIWQNPLEISTEMSKEQFNKVREGWDLLIDIDCKYFDYAKMAALAVIQVLKDHMFKNFGIKFSGSKGFHIIIPFKAFPDEVNGIKTKEMFPEWARIVAEYLKVQSAAYFEKEVIQSGNEYLQLNKKDNEVKMKCISCGDAAQSFKEVTFYCASCRIEETTRVKEDKIRRCAQCRREMIKKFEREFFSCSKCKTDSKKDSKNFSKSLFDANAVSAFDIILVSSRHLFRVPYSLHEKTGFASAVLSGEEIANFKPSDADPLKIKIKNFYPEVNKNEAKNLFESALEWYGENARQKESREIKQTTKPQNREGKTFQEIKVDKSSVTYPPSIAKILEGMEDGKKRALFILINFFRSLNFTKEEVEAKVIDWNKKNKKQLKEGYIQIQIEWAFKQNKRLPPNYDKAYYKDIGIIPSDEELKYKNPVNYAVKKSKWLKNAG